MSKNVPCLDISELIDRLAPFFTVNILARRNSGKSVIIQEMIQELLKAKKIDMVVVMSGSAGLNDDYNFLPKELVMPFSEEILENIWEKQAKTPKDKRKRVFIVLDDCLGTPEAIRSDIINKYFTVGRHVSTSFLISSQHTAMLLNPLIKANSDLLIWSKLSRQQLENLSLSTTGLTKQEFISISEQLGGENYSFVVLDNFINSKDPSEFLTCVRAKPPVKKDNKRV
jgi:hypothetical protein